MHQRTVLKSRVEILSHDPSTGLTLFKGEPAEVAYNKQMKDQFMKLMADLEKQKKKQGRTLEEGLEKAKKEKAWKKSKVYIKKKRPGRKSVKMIRRMVRSMKDPYPRINMTYRQRSCLKKVWVEPLWKTYTNRTLLLPAERDALLKKDAESSQTPPSDKQIQAMRCMSESMVRITGAPPQTHVNSVLLLTYHLYHLTPLIEYCLKHPHVWTRSPTFGSFIHIPYTYVHICSHMHSYVLHMLSYGLTGLQPDFI